jgi:hypothetical protein
MYAARLLGLVLAIPVTGCVTDGLPFGFPTQAQLEAKKVELAAKDDEVCKSYGATPGSDVYIQCRIAQVRHRDAAAEAEVPVVNNAPTGVPASNPPRFVNLLPPPRCTSRGC